MKINKILAGILACCVMGGSMPSVVRTADNTAITANAAEYTMGDYESLSFKNFGSYIEISKCDESAASVVIPAEIDGVPVTKIGFSAFYYCSDLTSVTIPDSVTSISHQAFYGCSELTEITIPSSVTDIGSNAFHDTPWLKAKRKENPLVIVNGILIDGKTCSDNVVIPSSVKCINWEAFSDCSELTSVNIPKSVNVIRGFAFDNTPWLAAKQEENPFVIVNGILIDGKTCSGEVVVPDEVTSIGEGAFYGCYNLTSVTIPDSVTTIYDGAFCSCSELSEVTISDNVTSIGISAFAFCHKLTSITIPYSVKSIDEQAFFICSELKEITILNPDCEIYDDSQTITDNYAYNGEDYKFSGTIYGYDDSTAQAYAEKYGSNFVSLGKAPLGDVNGDDSIDSSDASDILINYSRISTGRKSLFTAVQRFAADVDKDGKIDSSDASFVLRFYSYRSTGGTEKDMSKWMTK